MIGLVRKRRAGKPVTERVERGCRAVSGCDGAEGAEAGGLLSDGVVKELCLYCGARLCCSVQR